jgi:uncharacterized protein with GYD domain
MAKYILLLNWTEQGIKAIKDSPARYDAARDLARKCSCTLETIYMTLGPYDQVAIVHSSDDDSVALFALRLAALGNVRATTMRAFEDNEYRRIAGDV